MKRRTMALAMMVAVGMMLYGCGSSKYAATESASVDTMMENGAYAEETYDNSAVESELGSSTGLTEAAQENRKLIRTVNMTVETKEFDALTASIQARVTELGGYVQNSSVSGASMDAYDSNRYADMTLRIPSDALDGFLGELKEQSNVTFQSESVDDVTLNYVDVESHKKALEVEQERLLTLMEQAETMEDIIAIESRLSNIRYEMESYESQLRTYDNQIDYSTVELSIREVDRETRTEARGFWEEVSNRFSNSVYQVSVSMRSFAIWFLGSLPYLIVTVVCIAVPVLVIVLIFRALGRRGDKKKNKKEKISKAKSDEEP